jgi:hypothetical protein
MDPYALIAQYPNAGQAFSDAFSKGMQQNALAGFAMNPGDPNAQGAAARYDPGAVMQYRQGQQSAQAQLSQEQIQTWHHYAASLAKWADTPQKWDQAIDYLLQSNHPDISTEALMQLKGHFDPALRQSFMAMGGQQDDKPQQAPAVIQEYEYAKNQGYKGTLADFEQYLHPPGAVTVPAGATVSGPTAPTLRLNPQTGQWEPEGGAGGNASGGFPQ